MIIILSILIGFAIFRGFGSVKSIIRKEPHEDELSKKIMTKTQSISFQISLFLWLAIMYFSDKIEIESHSLIGAGIMGMAIVFSITWLAVKIIGIRNE